jgi:geranylgeranyl diphosphate synthase type I
VPVSAAIIATEVAVIILDDLYDQDRPAALFQQVGPERACNFASVFQTLSFRVLMEAQWPPATCQRILRVLCNGYLAIAAGQDRDLATQPRDLESYWAVAERKTGAGYATAMEAGALAATEDERVLRALRSFGYHTGLAVQIFNDLRGIWSPVGKSDLVQGKVTLPIVYALSCDHPDRGLLETIVSDAQVARYHHTIRQILDRIDVRAFLVWAALQQREKALQALGPVPTGTGTAFLNDFITGCFGNIDELLQGSAAQDRVGTERARQVLSRDLPAGPLWSGLPRRRSTGPPGSRYAGV